MASGDGHDVRMSRVAKSLRDITANRILRGLGDVPRGLVTVTRVDVTKDIKKATVYISVFTPDEAPQSEKDELIAQVFESLEAARHELARETNRQLRLKSIPKFEFVLDTGLKKMSRIAAILEGLKPNVPVQSSDHEADENSQEDTSPTGGHNSGGHSSNQD